MVNVKKVLNFVKILFLRQKQAGKVRRGYRMLGKSRRYSKCLLCTSGRRISEKSTAGPGEPKTGVLSPRRTQFEMNFRVRVGIRLVTPCPSLMVNSWSAGSAPSLS